MQINKPGLIVLILISIIYFIVACILLYVYDFLTIWTAFLALLIAPLVVLFVVMAQKNRNQPYVIWNMNDLKSEKEDSFKTTKNN